MIERNGGRVNVRITTKTTYIVCATLTKEVVEKSKSHELAIINEHYILDCISARKKLPVTDYVLQDAGEKRVKKDNTAEDSSDVYEFSESPIDDKENHMQKIRERLKQFSLKNNKRNQEDNADGNKKKKIKLVDKTNNETKEDPIPALKDLVFCIYGKFSIPINVLNNIILECGGSISNDVDDKVTHFLFGGESVDIPQFREAQKRKIHIVNEYFLRLLVKY